MAKPQISTKRLAITKANAQIVAVVAVASFVTIFCLVAAKTVWSQNAYQARVITADEKAHQQLMTNIKTASNLITAYQTFVSSPTNVIGGSTTGSGDNQGDNAKIVLDALPASYDFPGLTSSLEKILTDRNFTVSSISGTDDEVAQQTNTSSSTPKPVSIPFSFSVTNANYAAVQQLITTLQSSIRPIQIDTMSLSGGASDMQLSIDAHTYYQPEKDLSITKQAVK